MNSMNTDSTTFDLFGDDVTLGFHDLPPQIDTDMIDMFDSFDDPAALENWFTHSAPLINAEHVAGPAKTNPAPLLPPPSKNTRQRRSAEEWEEMRPIIEKLRMKELKSLAEIRQILADNYNFSASCVFWLSFTVL